MKEIKHVALIIHEDHIIVKGLEGKADIKTTSKSQNVFRLRAAPSPELHSKEPQVLAPLRSLQTMCRLHYLSIFDLLLLFLKVIFLIRRSLNTEHIIRREDVLLFLVE